MNFYVKIWPDTNFQFNQSWTFCWNEMRKPNQLVKKKFTYSYVDILLLQIVKVEQIPFLSAFYKKKTVGKVLLHFIRA